jgi:hypothetical protein
MSLISKIIKRNPLRKHNQIQHSYQEDDSYVKNHQTLPVNVPIKPPSELVVIGDLRSLCEGFQPSDQSSNENDAYKNYRRHCAVDSLTLNDLHDDIRDRSMEQAKKEKEQRRKERKHRKEQEKKQIRDENILTLYDLHHDIWSRNKYVRSV